MNDEIKISLAVFVIISITVLSGFLFVKIGEKLFGRDLSFEGSVKSSLLYYCTTGQTEVKEGKKIYGVKDADRFKRCMEIIKPILEL